MKAEHFISFASMNDILVLAINIPIYALSCYHTDHDDEAFCLEYGECRKKEDSQCGYDNEAQEQCPTGTVKCLQTGNCVEVSTSSCQNDKDSTFLNTFSSMKAEHFICFASMNDILVLAINIPIYALSCYHTENLIKKC
jgi:hypothetical protein